MKFAAFMFAPVGVSIVGDAAGAMLDQPWSHWVGPWGGMACTMWVVWYLLAKWLPKERKTALDERIAAAAAVRQIQDGAREEREASQDKFAVLEKLRHEDSEKMNKTLGVLALTCSKVHGLQQNNSTEDSR